MIVEVNNSKIQAKTRSPRVAREGAMEVGTREPERPATRDRETFLGAGHRRIEGAGEARVVAESRLALLPTEPLLQAGRPPCFVGEELGVIRYFLVETLFEKDEGLLRREIIEGNPADDE
jgi:hypothetical protein